MAINTGNTQNPAMAAALEKVELRGAPQNNDSQGRHDGSDQSGYYGGATPFTFADQSDYFGTSFTIINDGLMKASETLMTIVKNNVQTNEIDLQLIPLDHNNNDLGLDVLMVAVKSKKSEKALTAIYALVIANSGVTIGTDVVTADGGNRTFTVHSYPSQLLQAPGVVEFLVAQAENYLDRQDLVVYAGGCPIYSDFINFQDEKEMTGPLLNAMNACTHKAFNETNLRKGTLVDLNLAAHKSEEILECERKLTTGITHDYHGNPIRSDWQLTVTARQNKNQNTLSGYSAGTVSKEVLNIHGYTTVAAVAPGGTGRSSPWSRNRMANAENERIFMPVNVFTGIVPTRSQSLGNILWGIGVGIGAVYSDWWYALNVLNPLNRPVDNPHSIAGLGYELSSLLRMPEFKPLPTQATDPKYREEDFYDTLDMYFREETAFAIQVGFGSPTQWFMKDLIDAAFEPNEVLNTRDSINTKILNHANMLFNGRFDAIYANAGGSGRVVYTNPNRRYLVGRYHDNKSNTVRSLQDVDRLFLDNLINGQPEGLTMTGEFVMAQDAGSLDVQQAIGIQQEVVNVVMPHSQTLGYGVWLDLESAFVKALHTAILDMGPKLINRNATQQFGGQNMFATNIGDAMIDGLGRSILSNYATSRAGNNRMFFDNQGNVGPSGRRY